jgi:hypothetical protein
MTMIRQGDVLLVPADEPAGNLERATDSNGQPLQGLLIEGERTGHAHRLPARVYDTKAGERLLMLERPTPMTHEEHGPVTVPAGWWRPIQQREYVPAANPRRRSLVD